jgi:hypothetical protein
VYTVSWPSGLRRQFKALILRGKGSNPFEIKIQSRERFVIGSIFNCKATAQYMTIGHRNAVVDHHREPISRWSVVPRFSNGGRTFRNPVLGLVYWNSIMDPWKSGYLRWIPGSPVIRMDHWKSRFPTWISPTPKWISGNLFPIFERCSAKISQSINNRNRKCKCM